MDIDYSLNAIRIQKRGFFYPGERKVKYSEFKKLSDSARRKKRWQEMLKKINGWAIEAANMRYKFYLREMQTYDFYLKPSMEALKFQSDAQSVDLLETLVKIDTEGLTEYILEGMRTGLITKKTIRDAHFQDFLKKFDKNGYLSWNFHKYAMKKRQFGSKSLSASRIGDKETD